ncbi:MAG: ABC transporter permease subunit [Desulfobacterales bacterium]|nr:ABC transporter permease subunit [Desulfobacterales bacterium]MCP4159253.1 ABC transporter permease subunit [Deltaproteobacteria bacterium]
MIKLNPLTIKKIRRFKSIKRGYYSLILLTIMILVSIFAELFINSRALIVKYEGNYYFPTYSNMISGKTFGLGENYDYETSYRDLATKFDTENSDNWLLMPIIPFNPYEVDLKNDSYAPFPPSLKDKHFLGTDTQGRDIIARVVYGFRIAIFFSLFLLFVTYIVGITIGCLMGYTGKLFDLFFQRIIEIWSNVPFLYIVIIVASIMTPNFILLVLIVSFFGWTNMTWIMRTITYKEKEREYVLAAKSLGASNLRIIFKHIIPNTIAIIVTFAPFSISSGIVTLTSLDYLGFGLPHPTPSWGELLNQSWENLDAWWISTTVVTAMIITLTTVTFVGEAVREALDPKLHTIYE